MPTKVNAFSFWRAFDALVLALRQIKVADGYNTSPTVYEGAQVLSDIPVGAFPALALEMGDLSPQGGEFGGVSVGSVRYAWPAYVWGFVQSDGRRRGLYKNASALLADVMAVVWADETLPDSDGRGTTLFVEPGPIVFDVESFAVDNHGFFVAHFDLITDIKRSGTP